MKLCRLKLNDAAIVSISYVGPMTIRQINEQYVGHHGITDVISFVYENDFPDSPDDLVEDETAVEIFVCMDVALKEGKKRNGSSYAEELVLYTVHGLLHAAGEDDLTPEKRKRMRKRETEVMSELKREFDFNEIFPLP